MVLTISKSLLCLALLVGTAAAQKYTPPPPPLTPGPCVPTKKNPCDAPASTKPATVVDSNPFPGESDAAKPASPADTNPFPGEPAATKPAAPDAASQNPFPGEPEATKPTPPNAANQNPFPGEPESSSSSSSSSGSSSNGSAKSPTTTGADSVPDPDAANPAKPLTRTQRRHLAKVEDLDHRELEDLDIAKYYMSTGEFKAAYLRAKDAIATIPDDPDGHFALAAAAERLQSKDEAVKEYKTYLEMDPEGIHAKVAARALAALAPK